MKSEFSTRKETVKFINMWRLNNTLANNQQVKGVVKNIETNKNGKTIILKLTGCNKSNSNREVHRDE